jgi:predicted acyltransferase
MPAANARDLSLDSFRGTDVLLMILVNVQGNGDAAFTQIKHAEWTGMTLADLVFPVFLFIVGLSAPLAFDRPGAMVDWGKILRRTALLFLIGVALSLMIRPTLDPDMIRWTGVLQRIAIVYLICVAVIVVRRGIALPAGLAALCLVIHTWMILRVGAPTGGGPSLEPGMGISGWLDQNFIPGRVLRKTWEPEGVLSTLSATANGLIGVATMRWMQSKGSNTTRLFGIGAAMVVTGLALTGVVPLNKNLWTASFALATCGIGAMTWAALRLLFTVAGEHPIAQWSVGLGQAALTLYIVHTLLIAIIVRKLPNGEKIWDVSYQALLGLGLGQGFTPAITSMLYAIIAAILSCLILIPLQRRGWILKV